MDPATLVHTALLSAGIPLIGVSIGDATDKATWRIDYAPDATSEQRALGATIVDEFVIAAPRLRFISKAALAGRLTPAERGRLRAKLEAKEDAFLIDFWDLVQLRDGTREPLDLDSNAVIGGLLYLAGQAVQGNTISDPPVLESVGRVAQIRGLA